MPTALQIVAGSDLYVARGPSRISHPGRNMNDCRLLICNIIHAHERRPLSRITFPAV